MKKLIAKFRTWLRALLVEVLREELDAVHTGLGKIEFAVGYASDSLHQANAEILTHVAKPVEEIKEHISAEVAKQHAVLNARVATATQEVLYEAQLVRRLVCGFCGKNFAGRLKQHDGKAICPECAINKGLD